MVLDTNSVPFASLFETDYAHSSHLIGAKNAIDNALRQDATSYDGVLAEAQTQFEQSAGYPVDRFDILELKRYINGIAANGGPGGKFIHTSCALRPATEVMRDGGAVHEAIQKGRSAFKEAAGHRMNHTDEAQLRENVITQCDTSDGSEQASYVTTWRGEWIETEKPTPRNDGRAPDKLWFYARAAATNAVRARMSEDTALKKGLDQFERMAGCEMAVDADIEALKMAIRVTRLAHEDVSHAPTGGAGVANIRQSTPLPFDVPAYGSTLNTRHKLVALKKYISAKADYDGAKVPYGISSDAKREATLALERGDTAQEAVWAGLNYAESMDCPMTRVDEIVTLGRHVIQEQERQHRS